jgi:hypothetical protein
MFTFYSLELAGLRKAKGKLLCIACSQFCFSAAPELMTGQTGEL